VRPPVPPALARRIDRLAVRAHAFHRFAHHPLCEAYAGEVVRVGRRTRLCRGCLWTGLGAAAGAVAAATRPGTLTAALGLVLALTAALAGELWRRPARLPKVLTRFIPAAAVVGAMGGGPAPALVALTAVVLGLAWYRHRGPHRRTCERCPDRALVPCPGFAPMFHRERAFERLTGRWLATARRSSS